MKTTHVRIEHDQKSVEEGVDHDAGSVEFNLDGYHDEYDNSGADIHGLRAEDRGRRHGAVAKVFFPGDEHDCKNHSKNEALHSDKSLA